MMQDQNYSIKIDADDVLRGQGADPAIIRTRNMKLVDFADQAIKQAEHLLEPMIWKKTIKIEMFGHTKFVLENGISINNSVLLEHLLGAEEVTAIICTIGSRVHTLATETIKENMVLGLAIDGVGSAGVESLANIICTQMETDSKSRGKSTTIPLSPGMIGWPIEEGQPLLFELLSTENLEVDLSEYYLMSPRKTLSMLIGSGKNISSDNKICDFCQMNKTCKFKEHYHNEAK